MVKRKNQLNLTITVTFRRIIRKAEFSVLQMFKKRARVDTENINLKFNATPRKKLTTLPTLYLHIFCTFFHQSTASKPHCIYNCVLVTL